MDDFDEEPPTRSKRKFEHLLRSEKAAVSSEEEDDYMSQDIMSLVGQMPSKHERTAKSYQQIRLEKEREQERKNLENKTLPVRERERIQREEGLKKAMSISSVGFKLMQKMGYQQGQSLGKTTVDGLLEPLGVVVNPGRLGLGLQAQLERTELENENAELDKMMKAVSVVQDVKQFASRSASEYDKKRAANDLRRSLDAAELLDRRKDLAETEAYEGQNDMEKLIKVTAHLRQVHFYCVWCGVEYNDEADLAVNCPGDTYADHN